MTSAGGREVSGALTGALVAYVRGAGGEEALGRVFELAGERRPLEEVENADGWSSHEETVALFDAAAIVMDDPDIGRRVGEELIPLTSGAAAGTTEILRSLGSPGEVLRAVSVTAPKYSTIIRMDAVEIGDRHAVVSSVTLPPHRRHRHFCLYTAGVIEKAPMLFGMDPAVVEEVECQAEGDSRCLYRVTWDPTTGAEYDPAREVEYLRLQLESVTARFEALQATACELVSVDSVEEALQTITERAKTAIRAPWFLLAVRTSAGGDLRIHRDGLSKEEAAALATEILAEEPDDKGGSRLIVEVASGRQSYGRLAAIHPEGSRFFEAERRLLAAYAGNAAAALAAAAALEEARVRERTSRALLDLARSLSEVGTHQEVAERLARAVPAVVDCDHACVLLWDSATATMSPSAIWNVARAEAVEVDPEVAVSAETSHVIASLLEQPEPAFLDGSSPDEFVVSLLGGATTRAVVVPIVAKGVLYGAIAAAVTDGSDRLEDDDELTLRLAGMADHAATALENARLLERIRHQALHDALTGTPNQRLLQDRVEAAIALARRSPEHLALLFLDLDRFKLVNDTLGHPFGDLLLQHVAERLRSVVRASDTVARLGGDEFAILLPRLEVQAGAETVAEKLLEALEQPFVLGQHRVFVSGSIGIATYPDHGADYDSLLKNADAAMYQAKSRGRGVFQVYDPSMLARDHTHLALEADLHGAVDRGELRLLYQPQVDLETMQVVGAEALVRWQHPQLGLLGPDQFIPLAEETGLIVKIDAWVLRTACQQLGRWRRAGLEGLRVAVNLSGRDLRDPTLPQRVERSVREAGIEPDQLELEVTERVVEGSNELFAVLDQLRAIGVRLAIDDFGTGNSAFSRLDGGRIDILKIDKGFVSEINNPDDEAPLVSAMISLAHSLGLQVVAEGVETDAQGAFLRSRGCELMQGYAFSRPIPADEFERLAATPAS